MHCPCIGGETFLKRQFIYPLCCFSVKERSCDDLEGLVGPGHLWPRLHSPPLQAYKTGALGRGLCFYDSSPQ